MNLLRKYNKAFGIIVAIVLTVVLAPVIASAQAQPPAGGAVSGSETDPIGIDRIDNSTLALGKNSLPETVASIINVALSLLGIIAVVIVLAGGFKWMTAGGSEEKTAEARKLIFAGVIGLAIIMSAWAIARFVLVNLAVKTGVTGADYEI
ncbi:pilin [Patescibacteria group bacterium]|nr:pilin [Patescibacteria group bacterium]MBU1721255.1 pilin [Patescibacteria group bacterium]MBU1901037.1 pilin [Patescibacteria group bacterium]